MYKIKPSKYQEILMSKIPDNYRIDYNNANDQIKMLLVNYTFKIG